MRYYQSWSVKNKRLFIFLLAWCSLSLLFWFSLPTPLLDVSYSTVLTSRNGELVGAVVAKDDQWRFPPPNALSEKYITALLTFEDRRFFQHPGVDPLAIAKAAQQNLSAGRIVRGGSTITMQLVRMTRGNRTRTLWEKAIESILALRLECTYDKYEILRLYAGHAPFGGNTVGIGAASWRYLGKVDTNLSWAEAATLAVLPNAPALIHPGRNTDALRQKRNRLLSRLHAQGHLDSLEWQLATQEPLPQRPRPMPQIAPHFVQFLQQLSTSTAPAYLHQTTIDAALQHQINQTLTRHHRRLKQNLIHNGAILVLDWHSGEVMAYAGNVPDLSSDHSPAVDLIQAPRSTGSILKPLLYALALDDGIILTHSLLPDIPTYINGYHPENFHQVFQGAVGANQALIQSLNVPMVHLLQDFGLERFHYYLPCLGLHTFQRPAADYGLTLILGGGETTLWEITTAYAQLARIVDRFERLNSTYEQQPFRRPVYDMNQPNWDTVANDFSAAPVIGAGAIYLTLQQLTALRRPNELGQWQRFGSRQAIAWKTGTSYGFRDGWAVGLNGRYAVGVWTGNADGEGRPGLTGLRAAAPLLFDVFELLPSGPFLAAPYDDLIQVSTCKTSGWKAGPLCPVDTIWSPPGGKRSPICPYHRRIHTTQDSIARVQASCYPASKIRHLSWFVLPPAMASYYRRKSPSYRDLPPWRKDCRPAEIPKAPMELIYPAVSSRITIPRQLNGNLSKTVFEAAHQRPKAQIHWHLDNDYITSTKFFHKIEVEPAPGWHRLVLVDDEGWRVERNFEILEKEK